ncbi:hypothetical protein DFJ77DRAFT_437575 [Powellomyces hirtus]|nr:hypothetical protein DFJ77DRAFT_437575 [Powellomyces hirtus]
MDTTTQQERPVLNHAFLYKIWQRQTSKSEATIQNETNRLKHYSQHLHLLRSGEEMMAKIAETHPNSCLNHTKLFSKICHLCTTEEKRIILGDTLPEGADVTETFEKQVHSYFKKARSDLCKEKWGEQEAQEMSEKDKKNYVEIDVIRAQLRTWLKNISQKNIIENQFIVALGIITLSDKMRRMDPALIKFRNFNDKDEVILINDGAGFHIKECTKTKDAAVTILFGEEMVPYVKMLMKARIAKKQNYLFMKVQAKTKADGDEKHTLNPDTKWFSNEFNKKMKILFGKNLTTRLIRIAVSIKLSKTDIGGDLVYHRYMSDYMGHSYDMHNRSYNLFKDPKKTQEASDSDGQADQ